MATSLKLVFDVDGVFTDGTVYLMPDKTVFFSNLVPGTGPVDLFFRMSAITFLSLVLVMEPD